MDEEILLACIKCQQVNELAADTDRQMHLEGLEEEDEEKREDFACPFCSRDFDVVTLCHHIQDEHCFQTNSKLVCPICAAKIGKDMLKHLTLQHGSLFKTRRKKSRSGGISSNRTLHFLGKESHEGQHHSFHKRTSIPAGLHSSSATLDPLLSSFVCSKTICEAKKQSEPSFSSEESLTKDSYSNLITDVQVINSAESSLTIQDQEQQFEEVSGRINFVQHLVLSTILGDVF